MPLEIPTSTSLFDFFDPNPSIDYHAPCRPTWLFSWDAPWLRIPALTDLVLSQTAVDTTIKPDGLESDPYAVLTALHVCREDEGVKAIAGYCLRGGDLGLKETPRGVVWAGHMGPVLVRGWLI